MRRTALVVAALGFTLACSTEPQTVKSVTLSETVGTVQVGAALTLTATPYDQNDAAISGKTVTWVSSDTTVATVDPSGIITGVAAGTVTITATVDGVSASATITVTVPSTSPGSGA